MATSRKDSIQRAGTDDVLEIQDMASSFTKLIAAVRERDVDTAQKHSVAGLFANREVRCMTLLYGL